MATTITAGLPTPAPSSEIQAKPSELPSLMDREVDLDTHDSFPFSLPPAAMSNSTSETRTSSIASSTVASSESSYVPVSPPSVPRTAKRPASSRRKRSGANDQQNDYSLPPPPTRNRKIIQMNPRTHKEDRVSSALEHTSTPTLSAKPSTSSAATITVSPPTTGTKRKHSTSSPATTAGRKMARKTAHSLIERRRRSKMNEEFGVLKDMIPACVGQEMHKLAILQASIEYMRYLEKCLADLKTAHSHFKNSAPNRPPSPPADIVHVATEDSAHSSSASPAIEEIEPVELPSIRYVLTADPAPRPYFVSQPPPTTISPTTHSNPHRSSLQSSPLHVGATSNNLPPPLPESTLPSPAYEPSSASTAFKSIYVSSPIIAPNDDREATAALLMLNTDRRTWNGARQHGGSMIAGISGSKITDAVEQTSRGISVRDLLTT